MIIKWETISGDQFRGELVEVDNGTAIVRLDDGELRAVRVDEHGLEVLS